MQRVTLRHAARLGPRCLIGHWRLVTCAG
jgi:hypothetical protein